jgi:hypothetical protein
MRTRVAAGALVTILLAGAPAAPPAGAVTVSAARSELTVAVGQHFDYRARLVNDGSVATGQLLAHLNVASLTTDVYVDPEDWSSSRSTVVPALATGAGTELSWDLQAVSPGSFDVYLVVLPTTPASAAQPQRLSVSSPTHVRVTARTTLNAGGSLPVVLAVPVLLGLATLLSRRRRERSITGSGSAQSGGEVIPDG